MMPSVKPFTPSKISAMLVATTDAVYPSPERCSGARAVLRHGQSLSNNLKTRKPGGLHPMYLDVHGHGDKKGHEMDEIRDLLKDSQDDVLDAVSIQFLFFFST